MSAEQDQRAEVIEQMHAYAERLTADAKESYDVADDFGRKQQAAQQRGDGATELAEGWRAAAAALEALPTSGSAE